MRMLILGSTGCIGRAITAGAKAMGAHVVGVSRSQPKSAVEEHEHVLADRSNPSAIVDIVRSCNIDVVVDVVAYTPEAAGALLSRLDGKVGRYVLISSCDVYRNYGLLHKRESGEADGELNENAPLRASRFPYRGAAPRPSSDPDQWLDDYDKIPIENAVQALASDWTILRLPMVYGPGDRQKRFAWAIAPMLANAASLELLIPWAEWVTTYGYSANVGAAVSHAAFHARASRSIFNVADSSPVNHRAWIRRIRAATAWTGQVLETTNPNSPIAQATAALDLTVPLNVSAARLFDSLAFKPPVDIEEAVAQTVTSERRHEAA